MELRLRERCASNEGYDHNRKRRVKGAHQREARDRAEFSELGYLAGPSWDLLAQASNQQTPSRLELLAVPTESNPSFKIENPRVSLRINASPAVRFRG